MDDDDYQYEIIDEGGDLTLLRLIEERPELYDLSDINAKNRMLKENSWEEIAAAMGKSINDIQRRFTSIKETLRRNRKKVESHTRSGYKLKEPTWPLWKASQFLLNKRPRTLRRDNSRAKRNTVKTIHQPPSPNSFTTSSERTSVSNREVDLHGVLSFASQALQPENENALFARSIGLTLDRLGNVRAAKLKADICRLVLEAEIDDEVAHKHYNN